MSAYNEEGVNMNMPVVPAGYGGNGMGLGGDNGWWILLLFLFGMNGGWGNNGGYGGGGLYPWMNQADITTSGFQNQMLNTQLMGLQNSVTAGFGDGQLGLAGINQNICQTGNQLGSTMQNGFAQAEIGANSRQMANMNQMFGLQSAFQDCCCENRLATCQTQNLVQSDGAATRAAIQAQTQAILDQMCQDKIDQKNDTIAQLRSELMFARGQASQDVQTAAIQAGQRGLANEIEQYVLPTPRPAYIVQNPNCCAQNYSGCGCGGMM